ncbi:glycosyltransferase family 2 protein [Caldichromatium japonicum]
MLGWMMKDPKLFLVQSPHFFVTPDPIEKNLNIFQQMPSEQEMLYTNIQRGLDFWNASFFCGAAAVLRRCHLDKIGGFQGKTITEDAETALALHAQGYRSAYI